MSAVEFYVRIACRFGLGTIGGVIIGIVISAHWAEALRG